MNAEQAIDVFRRNPRHAALTHRLVQTTRSIVMAGLVVKGREPQITNAVQETHINPGHTLIPRRG
jgi:hypothetical protein